MTIHNIKDDWLVEYVEENNPYCEEWGIVGIFKDTTVNEIIKVLPINKTNYKFTSLKLLIDKHLLFDEEKGQSNKEYEIQINHEYRMLEDTTLEFKNHMSENYDVIMSGNNTFKIKYVDPLESARSKLSKQELAAIVNMVKKGNI